MDAVRQGYYGGKNFIDWKIFLQSFHFKDIIDDRLDTRQFPAVGGQRNPAASFAVQRYSFVHLSVLESYENISHGQSSRLIDACKKNILLRYSI